MKPIIDKFKYHLKLYLGVIGLLTLLTHPVSGFQQVSEISGTVTDENGEPLPGVNVLVKGFNSTGTITNLQGKYNLELPEQAEALRFSSVGYLSEDIPINGRSSIDVGMRVDVQTLREVVVVGYGTQRKEDITGAVGSVDAKEFNAGVIVSPEQLIQGKLAGVNITSRSGEPGASQTIIIRGPGSLRSGSNPLFVVDGVPLDPGTSSPGAADVGFGSTAPLNPLNFLNPNDIESIDVLKDASATAIYGSRGANGVILITTKKGSGQTSGLSYNNYFGISNPARKIDVLNAEEFIDFQETRGNADNIFDRNISTDWQDQVFREAFTQNHQLSLNGGSETSSYYVSLSYLDQEGLIETNEFKRYTGRFNFTQSLLDDRLNVNLNLTAGHTDNSGAPRGDNADANFGSLIPDMLGGNPTYPVRNPDGSLFIFPDGRNPLADLELYDDFSRTDRVLGNIEVALEIVSGLEYKINFGIDRTVGNRETQIKPSGLPNMEFPEGRAVFSKTEFSNSLIENYLKYNFALDDHAFEVLGGHSYQKFNSRSLANSINGFSTVEIDAIYNPGIGTSLSIGQNRPGGGANINELQSFFGRVNYSFQDKYLFTGTLRADGSSKFGENNKYGLFPSVSAAWKIDQEPFLNGVSAISGLKLRIGWGQTGNQEIPGKITKPSLTSSVDARGTGYPLTPSGMSPGFVFVRTANPNIQWEVTTQTNIGLDFELFQGSFYGSVDYFDKRTSDILLNLTVADPISPTGTRWSNVDMDIVNQGVEVALNYASSPNADFNWNLGVNGTFLNNEVQNAPFTFLRTGSVRGPGLSGVTAAGNLNGEPISTFYLLEHQGFDEGGSNVFRDTNNDGSISSDDRIAAGSPIPNFTYNMYGNFSFKNLELTLNFNGVSGNKIYNNTANAYFNMPQLSSGLNIDTHYYNEEENTTNSATESTRYLEDGDFLRLNNASLRYNFDVSPLDWVKNLSVYITGQNLFVVTDYSGYDPEVDVPSDAGGIQALGMDFTNYPRARTFLLGLSVGF